MQHRRKHKQPLLWQCIHKRLAKLWSVPNSLTVRWYRCKLSNLQEKNCYYYFFKLQSNLAIRNFWVTLKLFLNAKSSLLQRLNQSTLYKVYLMMNQEKNGYFFRNNSLLLVFFSWKWYPMKNQEKKNSVLQSIINLVPKGFHKMCESSILGTLFSVKPKN